MGQALVYPGQHSAIIDAALWDQVQARLQATAARKRKGIMAGGNTEENLANASTGEPVAPLIGRVFDELGDRLTPSHTNRHNRRFRYYVSRRLILGTQDRAGW